MKTYAAGAEVYDIHGRAGSYVARVADGHVVEPIFEDEETGEPHYGSAKTWREVFSKPPREKLAAEIAELELQLTTARSDLKAARTETATVAAERAAALKVCATHPDLTPVVEYIEGRITHVASLSQYGCGGITILPVAEAVLPRDADDRRRGEVRLLALYGGFTGPEGTKNRYDENFYWQLNSYRDGSGDNVICILGPSEALVRERLQAFLDREFKKSHNNQDRNIRWAADALKLGLNVPAGLAAAVEDRAAKAKAWDEEQSRKALASAERHVQDLRIKLGLTEAPA